MFPSLVSGAWQVAGSSWDSAGKRDIQGPHHRVEFLEFRVWAEMSEQDVYKGLFLGRKLEWARSS